MFKKQQRRKRRHKKVRSKIFGTTDCPRFCVFRSLQYTYGQLIDDEAGKTIITASDRELKTKKIKPIAAAFEVGKLIAKKALEKKIEKVVFDRGGYAYHGRVKAVAEGAREGGLKF